MNDYRTPETLQPWDRRRLLITGFVIVICLSVLVAGVVLAIIQSLEPNQPGDDHTPPVLLDLRDRVAAEPMHAVPASAAWEGVPALAQAEPIVVPEPDQPRGPAGVPTGFPHTPQGALAQLAAIQTTVLENMDVNVTRDVHSAWVDPDGVRFDDWVLTRGVQTFLGNSGHPGTSKSAHVRLTATPAGGIIKGTDGPDWVLACVLMDVTAVIRFEARIGFGHCERMAWTGQRWQITTGTPPVIAPSTLPGTQAAVEAGWRPWRTEGGPVR